jgi:hypothetical protein
MRGVSNANCQTKLLYQIQESWKRHRLLAIDARSSAFHVSFDAPAWAGQDLEMARLRWQLRSREGQSQ